MAGPEDISTTRHRVRTISSLTQEQVRRKRDTDRKAQRAHRQRTNARLQDLEEQLATLKAEQSQELGAAAAEINELRQTNEALKRRLRNVAEVTGSLTLLDVDGGHNARRYQNEVDYHMSVSPSFKPPPFTKPDFSSHDQASVHGRNLLEEPDSFIPENQLLYSLHLPDGQTRSATVEHPIPVEKWSFSDHQDTSVEKDDYLDGTSNSNRALSAASSRSTAPLLSPVSIGSIPAMPPAADHPTAIWNILPKHLPATCPLDHILLDFLSSRRLLIARGESLVSVIGPASPSISGLLNPELITRHPGSRVMVDVVTTFKNVNIQEKLGFLFIMHATMRWQIACSQETFERMPSWLHPTVLQIMIPHAAWIENIPWPRMRDLLIQNPVKYPFHEFSEMYSANIKLTWPHEPLDAVIQDSVNKNEYSMNPLFEKHIRKLESWTLGEPFKKQYPELASALTDNRN